MLFKENDLLVNGDNRYQIQGKIGSESSFGAVYKALDDQGSPVVVKQLLGPSLITRDTGLDYEYVRRTFEREARILLAHNNPGIVRALDFFAQDEDLLLVMEFINGEDLDQVLIKKLEEEGKPFAQEEAVAIGCALCDVIHAIHQLPGQVLYRDLKPRNIMWDAQNKCIKVIDFGTARFMAASHNPTQALGTPGYAPPEFYTTHTALSFAADVYTIGATLFELVTGELPEPLMTPTSFHGQEHCLDDSFTNIIRRAMSQNPADRYQTAQDMGLALKQLAGSDDLAIKSKVRNPYPYLSCLCTACGSQPHNDRSVFCTSCGSPIHVVFLRIQPARDDLPAMDLFLDKLENLIGRLDMDEEIYPDIDLSRYDPDCYVSRRHCKLVRKGTEFSIEALQTTNHTGVNGYPVSPGRAVAISSGTEIALANLKVRFITKPCLEQPLGGAA